MSKTDHDLLHHLFHVSTKNNLVFHANISLIVEFQFTTFLEYHIFVLYIPTSGKICAFTDDAC